MLAPILPKPLTDVITDRYSGFGIVYLAHNIRLHESELGVIMAEKLQQGGRLPSVTLQLVDGGTITLPDDAPTRYTALLFYRGHW